MLLNHVLAAKHFFKIPEASELLAVDNCAETVTDQTAAVYLSRLDVGLHKEMSEDWVPDDGRHHAGPGVGGHEVLALAALYFVEGVGPRID